METINVQNVGTININNVLSILLLQDGVRDKVTKLFNVSNNPEDLVKNINSSLTAEEKIENIFENVRDTDFEGIKIGKSQIDGLEYIFNENTQQIFEIGFSEIFEVLENDGRIIFQAIDSQIDGLYGYYDYTSGKAISDKSDQKFHFVEKANLKE